ncbi:hypothetical protein LOTGIDRAFT_118322 [Lottia gigantea]|uniref:protein acetyllysine N-acetyltransferase n=1 Tax=Lottia gigantea TaxID=225164 RepID=V4ALP5_LOTGI|nr:hypothetical protein LOTGIDRAFT_118322 [Lottia gigantea]ESO94511.1 hypothetical protein LOTGIDRAFT_118322 [Lottia gigantea]
MNEEEKLLVKEAAKTVEFFDSTDKIQTEASKVAELIRNSQHCVCFTGAGISTSAGIGDYRGKSGKWTQQDQEKITNSDLRPTYTHEALHKLIDMGLIKYIISQNGDGLHILSQVPPDKISELHGNVFIEKCELCGQRYERSSEIKKPAHAKQCHLCGLSHRTSRRCTEKGCKGYLIDTIINFKDNLEDEIYKKAEDHASKSDVMLCLGTTLLVSPANELVEMTREPQTIVICNRLASLF